MHRDQRKCLARDRKPAKPDQRVEAQTVRPGADQLVAEL
jgi:hypothetical protein